MTFDRLEAFASRRFGRLEQAADAIRTYTGFASYLQSGIKRLVKRPSWQRGIFAGTSNGSFDPSRNQSPYPGRNRGSATRHWACTPRPCARLISFWACKYSFFRACNNSFLWRDIILFYWFSLFSQTVPASGPLRLPSGARLLSAGTDAIPHGGACHLAITPPCRLLAALNRPDGFRTVPMPSARTPRQLEGSW